MRIATVIGNRPQFVKAAAVSRRLRERCEELIVHTGQHYDDELSRIFFEELGVPAPDRELAAGDGLQHRSRLRGSWPRSSPSSPRSSRSSCSSTATPTRRSPGALAAAQGGHAGGTRGGGHALASTATMPEELNRVLCDHASDLLLCSTETAMHNLEREGARRQRAPGRAT